MTGGWRNNNSNSYDNRSRSQTVKRDAPSAFGTDLWASKEDKVPLKVDKVEAIEGWSDSDQEKEADAMSAYTAHSSDSDIGDAFREPKKSSTDAENKSGQISRREKLLNQLREAEEAVAKSK